jgi:hypothetical protein
MSLGFLKCTQETLCAIQAGQCGADRPPGGAEVHPSLLPREAADRAALCEGPASHHHEAHPRGLRLRGENISHRREFYFWTEVGNVTSKRNVVTCYRCIHVTRARIIKSDNVSKEPRSYL